MKRLEIIGNKTTEEDILGALAASGVGKHYTLIPSVQGMGNAGPRKGDAVWPEENFLLIIYCEEHEAREIRKAVEDVRTRFPDEGIALFELG